MLIICREWSGATEAGCAIGHQDHTWHFQVKPLQNWNNLPCTSQCSLGCLMIYGLVSLSTYWLFVHIRIFYPSLSAILQLIFRTLLTSDNNRRHTNPGNVTKSLPAHKETYNHLSCKFLSDILILNVTILWYSNDIHDDDIQSNTILLKQHKMQWLLITMNAGFFVSEIVCCPLR